MFLSRTRDMLRRRWWLVVALALIGGIGAYFLAKSAEPYYASTLTGASQSMPFNSLRAIIQPIDELIAEGAHDELGAMLQITPEQAGSLKSVVLRNLSDFEEAVSARDPFLEFYSVFEIEASVYDQSVFEPLRSGLLAYIQSNAYNQAKVAFQQRAIPPLLEEIDRKIELAADTQSQPEASGRLIVQGSETQGVQSLLDQKLQLEKQLAFADDVLFLNGFASRRNPSGPGAAKYTLNGGLMGFLLGFALVLLLELNLIIKEEERLRAA